MVAAEKDAAEKGTNSAAKPSSIDGKSAGDVTTAALVDISDLHWGLVDPHQKLARSVQISSPLSEMTSH